MTVKERLIEYIKFKEISIRSFCRKAGLSETYVTSMRNSIQPDKLLKISMAFPDLNTAWLLTGEGDRLKPNGTMPPIERDVLVSTASELFKDKLIQMFKDGEIFSATIVWEQHRMIIELTKKNEELIKQVEMLKNQLGQHGIEMQE